MKKFWNAVDGLNVSRVTKYELTVWASVLGAGLLGLIAGSLLVCLFSLAWEWCLIMTLACGELAVPGLFLYACRHDYHNGRFRISEKNQR